MDYTTIFGQAFDARHVTLALHMMLWAVALAFTATRLRRTEIDE